MDKKENYSVKREIKNTLLELMREKDYFDISVTDVVKKAEVARASFYRNFGSTMDIIDEIAEEISDELINELFPLFYSQDDKKWRDFLFDYFYFFKREYKNIANLKFENMSLIFNCIDKKIQAKDKKHEDNLNDKYILVAKIGIINGVTKKWIDSGIKESPEELVNYLMTFITKF